MAWRRPGDKPLSEPMMVGVLTHICVTRPQWVKPLTTNLTDVPNEVQISNKMHIEISPAKYRPFCSILIRHRGVKMQCNFPVASEEWCESETRDTRELYGTHGNNPDFAFEFRINQETWLDESWRCKSHEAKYVTLTMVSYAYEILGKLRWNWELPWCVPLLVVAPGQLPPALWRHQNWSIFRVTDPLCGECTGHRWIPLKGRWRGALMFSLICA